MSAAFDKTIALVRAARLALHVAQGLALATIYARLAPRIRRRVLQGWSAGLLDILNVRIQIAGDHPLHALRRGLIVTNHISWLDVFVLNAVVPVRFVAKSEVQRWLVIGWLCTRAQTLFIERGKARAAARISLHMAELLRQGECLAVFPEGTTTDGAQVAHFHASLLQPAIDAAAQVLPVAIRYQDESGERSTAAAYVDELSFGASLWNILSTPVLHVHLLAGASLNTGMLDRRSLARTAHERISGALDAASSKFHIPLTPVQHRDTSVLPSTR